MPYSGCCVSRDCEDHEFPPSVVRFRRPVAPATHPFNGSTKNTEVKREEVPLVTRFHFFPPSTVRKMVPPDPTAQPFWTD